MKRLSMGLLISAHIPHGNGKYLQNVFEQFFVQFFFLHTLLGSNFMFKIEGVTRRIQFIQI